MKRMEVEVILGNPKIKCEGYGICKFITNSNHLQSYCKNINQLVKARLQFESGVFCVCFDKDSINDSTNDKYFANGLFKIESDTEVPKDIVEFFQMPPSVLMTGIYKIDVQEKELRVNILIKSIDGLINEIRTFAA